MDDKILSKLRTEVDTCDEKLLGLIKKRIRIATKIKELKKIRKYDKVDVQREKEICRKIKKFCSENNLNTKKIRKVFEELFEITRGRIRSEK
jgi:chorismate mutase